VNESETFNVRLSDHFERTQQKLIDSRYRKNRGGRKRFEEVIQQINKSLSENPRLPQFRSLWGGFVRADPEPYPKGSSREGYELWKLKFKMPQLGGAAEQGRLIYLLDVTQQEVILVWIYTHAEFEKRPPERDLKRLLLELIESPPGLPQSNAVESGEEETGTEEGNPEESSRDE
jgi:hypothetical protein